MPNNDDRPTPSLGGRSPLSEHRKWAVVVGVTVLVIAVVGVGITALLGGTGVVPVLAVAIAAIGGAAIAAWIIKGHAD